MRIVGINGIRCYNNPIWENMTIAFRKRFPEVGIAVEEDTGCEAWEFARLRRFGDRILEKYDDGEDVLLVGHSMGGITACAIAPRFVRSDVRGIVTIFAPHSFLFSVFSRRLRAHTRLQTPIITFSAIRDEYVWWGSRHKQSVEHIRLDCNHFDDLVANPRHAEQIADKTKSVLFSHTRA